MDFAACRCQHEQHHGQHQPWRVEREHSLKHHADQRELDQRTRGADQQGARQAELQRNRQRRIDEHQRGGQCQAPVADGGGFTAHAARSLFSFSSEVQGRSTSWPDCS
ncbi:hypothetical protein SDC9_184895 [bioreactor metagenome]|uniref:Uncharacterized protein n=1 Tax=bioreactor metagenome TaxID=1076179 RepID=A0A645HEB6_9ZZZZ